MAAESKQAFEVGEKCMADVGRMNSPTGTWEAVVTSCEERGDTERRYYIVSVKLDDPRLVGTADAGREPSVHYKVHPYNTKPFFDRLREQAEHYERKLATAATRERALLDALSAVGNSEKVLAALGRIESAIGVPMNHPPRRAV